MEPNEIACLVALHSLEGIGSRSLCKIKKYFGSFKDCFFAPSQELHSSFLKAEICNNIVKVRSESEPARLLNEITARGIKITTLDDKDYPSKLSEIYDPPYILYYQGQIETLEQVCLAVVGSRQASNYGRSQARRFARELSLQGMVIVSGMARGIDTEAHRGALEAGGKTAAVLGSGLNVIYPPENARLYTEIISQGVVISEFPPQAHPEPGHFPLRNRVISGLSRGVLVIEAQERSGALITADFALEQGRDVYALPGPVDRKSSIGTNRLIKQGAELVTEPEDILLEYRPDYKKISELIQEQLFVLSEIEKKIINYLDDATVHINDIIYNTGLDMGTLSSCLLQMEFKGIIKALPGNYYQRT
ncbi:DNA recombination-mediator protein A [Syntrophomonas zehnderi OL-4]|uniref:DNA recombination-mediator protein A n=1 Tax=Syntrophomonas zehnderi OL-4 TaxID=690567 RepID=A0A0E4GBV8_9FIRM|nr:DNA-processing protein DprA [Syntrophomonas zehnderi]CFX64001.1 DNA recombination-mediator protein A [Syntrophomonas zehnderi OL-4]